jgi:hypothetical protein
VPAVQSLEAEATSIVHLDVRVRNTSAEPWPADRFVSLGNHWRDAAGAVVDVALEMQAPAEPGAYLLELDLVIEGVAWFADRGCPTTVIDVRVVPRTSPPSVADAIIPVMEMHGVPRADVEEILRRGGLDIVTVEPTDKAAGWNDYWYVAVKPDPR